MFCIQQIGITPAANRLRFAPLIVEVSVTVCDSTHGGNQERNFGKFRPKTIRVIGGWVLKTVSNLEAIDLEPVFFISRFWQGNFPVLGIFFPVLKMASGKYFPVLALIPG